MFPNLAHHQWGCLMSSVDKYGIRHSVREKLTTEGLTARSKTLYFDREIYVAKTLCGQ